MIDLRQIHCFVALYEEQSVTKAARRLHIVQPAVSMQIRKLESTYDITLFERTPQGMLPNVIADKLYPLCINALAQIETIAATLAESKMLPTGRITIGTLPSIAREILAEILVDFHTRYPGMQLNVQEGYNSTLIDAVVDGTIDLAVVRMPIGDTRLKFQLFLAEEMFCIAHRSTLPDISVITGRQAAALKLALPSQDTVVRSLIDSAFRMHDIEIRPAMEVGPVDTMLAMANYPGWATILPRFSIEGKRLNSDVCVVKLVEPKVESRLVVATSSLRETPIQNQLLIQAIGESLASKNS